MGNETSLDLHGLRLLSVIAGAGLRGARTETGVDSPGQDDASEGNRLELVGSPDAFERTNRDLVPARAPELFTSE